MPGRKAKFKRSWRPLSDFSHMFPDPGSTSPRSLSPRFARWPVPLLDLPEQAYVLIVHFLEPSSLCRVDATCRDARALGLLPIGPWCSLGSSHFAGMELETEGAFDSDWVASRNPEALCKVDWKKRYSMFQKRLPNFRWPFAGRDVIRVTYPDQLVYFQCVMHTKVPAAKAGPGVYLELLITSNPDNLSFAVVDVESGGHRSVTFSPDTGAVIREQRVQEDPRMVEGYALQPLEPMPHGTGNFTGHIGIYLYEGHLAFLRKITPVEGMPSEITKWQTTGWVTDLSWAESGYVTPCLAFRDEGVYGVRVNRFCQEPPLNLPKPPSLFDEEFWIPLYWEAEWTDDDDEDY